MMRRECWHLSEGLIFVHFAVFVLAATNRESLQALALIPGAVAARPWTLVTFQFIPQSGMFWFFISMLVLWVMAKPIEDEWGSPRFLLFWLVATAGAAGVALLLGAPIRVVAERLEVGHEGIVLVPAHGTLRAGRGDGRPDPDATPAAGLCSSRNAKPRRRAAESLA